MTTTKVGPPGNRVPPWQIAAWVAVLVAVIALCIYYIVTGSDDDPGYDVGPFGDVEPLSAEIELGKPTPEFVAEGATVARLIAAGDLAGLIAAQEPDHGDPADAQDLITRYGGRPVSAVDFNSNFAGMGGIQFRVDCAAGPDVRFWQGFHSYDGQWWLDTDAAYKPRPVDDDVPPLDATFAASSAEPMPTELTAPRRPTCSG